MPETCSSEPAIIVMAKAPRPGEVKTRLCPPLTPEQAADLAARFASDAAAKAANTGAAVVIAYAPDEGRALLEPLLPPASAWLPQTGADLGSRMQRAMEDAHTLGYGPLLVIGTDSPTLPPEFLSNAIALLSSDSADAVFGPTEDGGFYLVGSSAPIPGLFNDVAWSTPTALADTLRNAVTLGLAVEMLPAWYDVDTPEDLARLRAELLEDSAMGVIASQTAKWLRRVP
jgi:rSAM/selenodomain-associated transferase 1